MCQYCLLNKCKLRIIRKDKMPRIFILFTSLILLYASSASGDEINYQFTSISVEEGLSQSTVQSILLDKKGKLWIGTRNGLNFYTGQDLKIFKSNSKDRYSLDRKSTRLNSSHSGESRMPSSA